MTHNDGFLTSRMIAPGAVEGKNIAWNSLIQELSYSSNDSWSAFGSIYYREYDGKSWPAPFKELYGVYVVHSSNTARQSWLGGIVADKNGVSTIREYRPSDSIVTSTFKIIGIGELQI